MNSNAPTFNPGGGYGSSSNNSSYYGDEPSYYGQDAAAQYAPNEDFYYTQQSPLAQPHQIQGQDSFAYESGSFYPINEIPPQVLSFGCPVTALAYDTHYDAMYSGSTTAVVGNNSYNIHHNHHGSAGMTTPKVRAAMLATLQPSDGMIYATVQGHAEAPSSTLHQVYQSMYGGQQSMSNTNATTPPTIRNPAAIIPSHAYRPPYGLQDPALLTSIDSVAASTAVGLMSKPQKSHQQQMGIQRLLTVAPGHVASVSPAAVRVHTAGGMVLADTTNHSFATSSSFSVPPGNMCLCAHPGASSTNTVSHVVVGGIGTNKSNNRSITNNHSSGGGSQQQVVCLDVWQGLRPIQSYSMRESTLQQQKPLAVTALATNHAKGTIIVGCSDGSVRLLDQRLREVAHVVSKKQHHQHNNTALRGGSIMEIAVSPQDGRLLATTAFAPTTTIAAGGLSNGVSYPLHHFLEPTVKIYDIRYLGRGSFPHFFAGVRGAPRFLEFLHNDRLVVASGAVGGGIQIITPFDDDGETNNHGGGDAGKNVSNTTANFIVPTLERGEAISSVAVSLSQSFDRSNDRDVRLALGTTQGRILQYKMAGYESTKPKESLEMPLPYQAPELSLEASLLQRGNDANVRLGLNDRSKCIFSNFVLLAEPTVSSVGMINSASSSSFGPLANYPVLHASRLKVSSDFIGKATHQVDFLTTVLSNKLQVDLFQDHRPSYVQKSKQNVELKANPNKFLYSNKLFPLVYHESLNTIKKNGRRRRADDDEEEDDMGRKNSIPPRYRLTIRVTHKSAASFNHAEYNTTGWIPGWDYPPTMPNSFVSPVLMLLYFIPQIRQVAGEAQVLDRLKEKGAGLAPELGYLFFRITSIAKYALLFPTTKAVSQQQYHQLKAWSPADFISCLAATPEAEHLQILDGSPAAVDTPRRPEAFYRFLLYQLDKEVSNKSSQRPMEMLGGIDFTSVNEFISGSGPPSMTCTKALTVDLCYENKNSKTFADFLRHSLCRETRLRAWNQSSKSYETIIQRKIATSLPTLLSLSASCAGRKEEEGLFAWRGDDKGSTCNNHGHWLPEYIEVELQEDEGVTVRQLADDELWVESTDSKALPDAVAQLITKQKTNAVRKRTYRLDAVLSIIRDHSNIDSGVHFVLHARVPKTYKKEILMSQMAELQSVMDVKAGDNSYEMTVMGKDCDREILAKRMQSVQGILDSKTENDDLDWVLLNGFAVTHTVVEDARAFHVKFKEPCLVVFRAVDEDELCTGLLTQSPTISTDVIRTTSMTNAKSPYANNQRPNVLPGKGDLVAFDAEFVSVQEEESSLSETGSKLTIREIRYALARISAIDCRTTKVIFDDHVLPREPVVDYLTRFSGIVEKDLNPKQSRHHLISTRAAYLKLRCLLERGCVFIGHGLQQDFWTANLAVPDSQIIDTVELYHKPAQRYISLRFLTNFVLNRDMQQDVHDSVEDALAAFQLYEKAVEQSKAGTFDKLLDELYDVGVKSDWKLGVNDDGN